MSQEQPVKLPKWLAKHYPGIDTKNPVAGSIFLSLAQKLDKVKQKKDHIDRKLRDSQVFSHFNKCNDTRKKLREAINRENAKDKEITALRMENGKLKHENHNLLGQAERNVVRIQDMEEESRKNHLEIAAMKAALKWKNLRSTSASKEDCGRIEPRSSE